ncbi:GreA/GreB family elongation factor [Phosphitispora fastidiosa]|uniref:GreA/GreB family elongation factor n=1 Tax=Phosphitispora fastidiosa TaxID=2837202 RepID=UPI001E62B53B|nr:GreA/GreB family elongation factor [Phosphitispora fastidiosa]MBU7005540.1 hypothetical protein [Phosphitispora fastidiosa]
MHLKAEQRSSWRNSVRLNSIVTLRYQYTVNDEKETAYETFKIVGSLADDCVHNCVSFSSKTGKALWGGVKDQNVSIEGYDTASIVKIVNNAISYGVGQDSIIEIELYKDFDCTDFAGTKVVGCHDDIRSQFKNKEINSVVKLYHPRKRPEFAKIRGTVSCQEAQLIKGANMNSYLDAGDYREALKAISGIREFIVDSGDITENTIEIIEKMVICYLNTNSVTDAIDVLNYLLNFKFDKGLMNKVNVMINILTKVKAELEASTIEEKTPATRSNAYSSYAGLGRISSDLGVFSEAINFYKKAIKIGHDQQCGEEELIEAYKGLVTVFVKTENIEKAQQYAEIWNGIAEKVMNADLQKTLKSISDLLSTFSNNPRAKDTKRRILALLNCA